VTADAPIAASRQVAPTRNLTYGIDANMLIGQENGAGAGRS
jgi:hypothetical protein